MPPEALDTFPKILDWNAKNRGDVASSREKEFGIWQSYTWAEQREEIRALALGLKSLGLNPGDRVSIVGSNRPRLYWAMVAIQSCGAIPVPVYQDSVAEEMQYVLEHAGSRMVFCENQEQVDKVQSVLDRLPAVEQLIYCDPRGMRKYDHTALHSFTDLQEKGRAAKSALEPELEAIIAEGGPDDTCVMLYTSGTTGKPKGVVLSNRNIVFAGRSSTEFDRLTTEDSVLAYLPMAWVGDFIFSIGQSYIAGFAVSCPEGEDTMMADLREIGPSYFFAPPRIFENLLTSITIRMEDASPFKQRLYKKYMDHAARVGADILDGKPVSAGDKLKYQMGEFLIYGPLKDSLGMSKVRLAYTAGEAIGPEIFAFYRSLGINLKQLYGQTEASVFVTSQTDGDIRTDTVGPAWPGVELKIDDKGEVWYRSPGVFVEYYKMPEKTAETKDAEG